MMNKNTHKKQQQGFTLIEIMVVLVILGILASLVAPNVMNRVDDAMIQQARSDMKSIETALKMYKLDNYTYPTTEQGLEALVSASGISPQPKNFKKDGYLERLPNDPWGGKYLYLNPGEHGPIDIYTLGADGQPGGEDLNADIGNWQQGGDKE